MKVLDMPRSRCAVPGNHWNKAEVSLMDEWFLTYVWSTVSRTLETESPWPLQYLAVGPRQTLGSLGSMQWRTVSEDWHVGITDPNAQVPFSDDGLYTLDYRQTDLDCAKDHRRLEAIQVGSSKHRGYPQNHPERGKYGEMFTDHGILGCHVVNKTTCI